MQSRTLQADYTISKTRNLSNNLGWHNIFTLLYYWCKSYFVRFLVWEVLRPFGCCNLRIAVHTLLCLYALSGLLYPFDGMWAWHMFFYWGHYDRLCLKLYDLSQNESEDRDIIPFFKKNDVLYTRCFYATNKFELPLCVNSSIFKDNLPFRHNFVSFDTLDMLSYRCWLIYMRLILLATTTTVDCR